MLNTERNKMIDRYRFIGWGLLGLTVLANIGMAHHPYITQPDAQAQIEQMAHIAPLTAYVHGLLILVILTYTWLFTLYSGVKNISVAWLGTGLFAIGSLAMLGAGLISGFLSPAMMLEANLNTPEDLAIFHFQSRLMWHSNQVLTNFGTLAWLCAVMVWSGDIVRDDKFGRWVGAAGILIGIVGLLGIATGELRLDVTGMGLLLMAISVWFCALACYLLWLAHRKKHV